ncbi:Protein-S-isoprenylcysteine O-methyltransferase B [Grifola frondosa]|uniref:Protein-S-isoprenylcysteine O-methyltransferase n=1 Tax=Grifola frondosa TaxID=5627 RepID=A0A1C7LVH5_GRIFR|nr:Protein-S-isoprenylcysteine O-methyltransferase B [Grifola frondosa]
MLFHSFWTLTLVAYGQPPHNCLNADQVLTYPKNQSYGRNTKVPLLAVAAAANFVTFTSPNPRTASDEQRKYSSAGYFLVNVRPPWLRALEQAVTQSMFICEIMVILAIYFPSVALLRIFPVLAWIPFATTSRVRITPTFLTSWVLITAGGLLRLACYRALGRHFTFELALRKDHKLITDGPYSIVRHPSYTGMLMVTVGKLLILMGSGSWLAECGIMSTLSARICVFLWVVEVCRVPVVLLSRVSKEDEILRKEFGDQWMAWSMRTPYKLVPGII